MDGLNRKTIEIVDNHIQSAISISNFLEFKGFRTVQAYNPKDAVAMAKEEDPDLIILDWNLNGPSGESVAKALPKKKIIMTIPEMDKFRKERNVIAVVPKPVDNLVLFEEVKKALKIK